MAGSLGNLRHLATTVHVGVTGHTNLQASLVDQIRAAIEDALARIAVAASSLNQRARAEWPELIAEGPPRLRLLCGMAPGSDQLAAEIVEKSPRLRAPSYEILPILAAPAETYAGGHYFDHLPDERDRLLFHAARAMSLDGPVVTRGITPSAETARLELEAQADAGDLLLAHCDILLAIIDPNYREGRSESHRMVASARVQGIPVVQVTFGGTAAVNLRIFFPQGGSNGAVSDNWAEELLGSIVVPPSPDAHGHSGRMQKGGRNPQLAHFLHEPARTLNPLMLLYNMVWPLFERLFAGSPRRILTSRPRPDADEAFPISELAPEYERIDSLARRCMTFYRSSFVLNYSIGAIAVTMAFLSFAAARHSLLRVHTPAAVAGQSGVASRDSTHASRDSHDTLVSCENCEYWSVALGFAECILIVLVALNYSAAVRRRWQDRATDYRLLAEFFRSAAALAPFGRVPPFPRPGGHTPENPRRTWIAWYFRAVMRDLGPRRGNLRRDAAESARLFRETMLLDQIRYHARTAHKYERLHGRLEWLVTGLFATTILICVLHAIAGRIFAVAEFVHPVEAWLALVLVALPAWAGAAHAIGSQADAKRLHQASGAMRAALMGVFARLSRPFEASTDAELEANIPSADTPVPTPVREATQAIADAVEIMIAEAAEWRIAYRVQHTTPP